MGVVGVVSDPTGETVAQGTVVFVPSGDVAGLAGTPIDLSLTPDDTAALSTDEPLEDLLDSAGETYVQAPVDASGVYRLETLPSGDYFVVWVPDPADSSHLPGGSECRRALSSASLVGTQVDIRVSGNTGVSATYVGSSTCMVCHGLHRSTRTGHRVGLQVPASLGPLQDTSPWPVFDQAIDAFDEGTTLYYFNCNGGASGFSKCKVSDAEPGAGVVSFEVSLDRDEMKGRGEVGEYFVEVLNRRAVEPTRRYDAVLTYGGAVHKQRYLTRFTNEDGSYSYHMLMVQHNYEGDILFPDSNDWPWRDYHSERWYDHDAGLLIEPSNSKAFDSNCAGCHFTGFGLGGSDENGWSASAVPDPDGVFDFDGDGRIEEINTGCEACHGPGSQHLEGDVRGAYIVSPSLLTPSREVQICGACHSRPKGIGAGGTDAPLSAQDQMPRPGVRRAEFASEHTTRVDGAASNFHASGDSKSHHQQFSDFIQSVHYRNDNRLVTCTGCHDPHGNDENDYQLFAASQDNTLCTVCHSVAPFEPVLDHVGQVTGFTHAGIGNEGFYCTMCHMVDTASSGAKRPQLLDFLPPSVTPVQYFHGDISGHRFTVPLRDVAQEQPSAFTHACGICHGTFLPNP